MENLRVLVVDDEPDIVDIIVSTLSAAGIYAEGLTSPDSVVAYVREFQPDVLLLDRILPGILGTDIVRDLRKSPSNISVIMITAVDGEREVIDAFELGVDDYVKKPFSAQELVARVRAVVRRSQKAPRKTRESLDRGAIHLDLKSYEARVSDRGLALTLTEFKLLHVLIDSPEEVHSRARLRELVLGNQFVTDRTIDVHVASLRRKLGDFGHFISTVRGVGYRFKAA